MNITIKPYSKEYAKQCADLQKYLWKEDKQGREERFDWAYDKNPNNTEPLSLIAVNENDEVLGFRGYFLNRFFVNNEELLVAQIADTVVSKKARRRGIFQKMNNHSIEYLSEKNVPFLLNIGPSWPPYYGYKKIGFEDLAPFHSKYRFSLINLLNCKLFKIDRCKWRENIREFEKKVDNKTYIISNKISDNTLSQIETFKKINPISSFLTISNLKWRSKRPNRNYIYAYVLDNEGVLISFVMFKTNDFYNYDIGLLLTKETKTIKLLMQLFRRKYKPAVIAAWDFALHEKDKLVLKKLGMYSIPFINKIRKNPPALIRALQENEDGSLNWIINGVDIRNIENWTISKIDLDSF